jgi:NAD(P)-dependent dehydrogenase (short-subunit alcohol dehydrogenase family)
LSNRVWRRDRKSSNLKARPDRQENLAMPTSNPTQTILLIGASRGLGYAMAAEFAERGWNVVATVRGSARTALHDLAGKSPDQVEIEAVDIAEPDQVAALRARLSGRQFDMVFVNAGISNGPQETVSNVTTEDFVRVLVTNALSPMRVIEAVYDLLSPTATIGVMSSGLGSVTNNTTGMWEVYRASKAALNTLMRSFAARQTESAHPMVVMAPGWVRTDMGGPNAHLSIEESIPNLVKVLISIQEKPGLRYLDYLGQTVPW